MDTLTEFTTALRAHGIVLSVDDHEGDIIRTPSTCGAGLCPIVALARARFPQYAHLFENNEGREIGRAHLDMPGELVDAIIAAADADIYENEDDCYYIRRELLLAGGQVMA